MGELVRLTFPDRTQWLEGRSRGIGGSEAAAAIGRSPWKTALTLWKEKTGAQAAPDLGGNEAVELGRRMEPAIRDFFMAQYPGYELYYGAFSMASSVLALTYFVPCIMVSRLLSVADGISQFLNGDVQCPPQLQ